MASAARCVATCAALLLGCQDEAAVPASSAGGAATEAVTGGFDEAPTTASPDEDVSTTDMPDVPARPIPDGVDVPLADPPPPPVSGGTLLATADEQWIVAADSDRDLIHVFSRALESEAFTIELPPGSEPGRVVEDGHGRAFVAMRRSGEVVELEVDVGVVVAVHRPCKHPRGLAFDGDALLVACAERVLARVDRDGVVTRIAVDEEIRDIVSTAPLRVSTFRSPGLAVLAPDGSSTHTVRLQPLPVETGGRATPTVAVRTIATPDGWLMLHRLVTSEPLRVVSNGYYGPGPCSIPVASALSQHPSPDDGAVHTRMVALTHLVDVAITDDGSEIAVVGRDPEGRGRYARLRPFRSDSDCTLPAAASTGGDPVAIDYDGEGNLWVLSREPAELYRIRPGGHWTAFVLYGASVYDTGHELFHVPTRGGLACATCHPEGRDDGATFAFAGIGPRRTQALDVDLEGTEPFHWSGDQDDMLALVHEIRVRRMGGPGLHAAEKEALARWVFALPRMTPPRSADDAAARRGEALFEAVGCATCHAGPQRTNAQTVAIGGHALQVPTLLGVFYRPPYMHDGRATDLRSAVLDMIAHSEPGGPLASGEVDDLVAYLESL